MEGGNMRLSVFLVQDSVFEGVKELGTGAQAAAWL
jgi:hypothetical protein